jgi:hypothetical protein
MPIAEPEYLEFPQGDFSDVAARMQAMRAAHRGWINFEPGVLVDDAPPPRSGLFSLFSARGPAVPLATWVAGEERKGRTEPPTIGILHASGWGVRRKLAEAGHAVPEGWVVQQENSKKGLVVAVPPTVGHAEVVEWLLAATAALSTVPLTGRWRAAVYDG